MTELKLVTDAQTREVGKLARDMRLPREVFQAALSNGAVEQFLRGLVPNPPTYPDWVYEHLTPEYEVYNLVNPGMAILWQDLRQDRGDLVTGFRIYEKLKQAELLERSLSYGHLRWYETNPNRVPSRWRERGVWVHGWASVVRAVNDTLYVPGLRCGIEHICVSWDWIGLEWHTFESAGLLPGTPGVI